MTATKCVSCEQVPATGTKLTYVKMTIYKGWDREELVEEAGPFCEQCYMA